MSARDAGYALLERLYEIGKRIAQFDSIERTVPEIFAVLARALPLRSAILMLDDPARARPIEWHAPDASAARQRTVEHYAHASYRYLAGALAEPAADQPGTSPDPPDLGEHALLELGRSPQDAERLITLPLVVAGGSTFGVLQVEGLQPFDEGALLFLNAVANQLAIALAEKRRLLAEERRVVADRERILAEELRRRYEALLDNLDHAFVWEAAPDARFISYVSARAESLLGYPLQQWIAERDFWLNRVHPEDRGRVRQTLGRMLKLGKDERCEHRCLTRDGRVLWLHTGMHLTGASGERPVLQAVSIDITPSKQVEEALRESEARFRSVAETVPCIIFIWRPDGSPEYVNRWFYEYTGLPESGAAGGSPLEALHSEDATGVRARIDAALRAGQPWNDEYRLRRADGTHHWFQVRAIPQRDGRGEIRRWFGAALDIHGLVVAREELRESDRHKDEFLATLSHELRNPLAPLRNGLQILRLRGGADAAEERLQEMMERQVRHLIRLVDDLLEISRISRGQVELRRERVALSEPLGAALESCRPQLEAARHRVSVVVPAEPLVVYGDSMRLSQILSNLLGNAAKYTPEGGEIHVVATRSGGEARLIVRDTGIGIPPEMLERVFEMFSQLDRAHERTQGGLGIGLALVRSLVRLHGGRVEARSEGPGRGSEFVIHLPLAEAAPVADHAESGGAKREAPAGPVPTLRILVVDDNHDAADSLGQMLTLLGSEVHVVYDGTAALQAMRTHRPQLALLDLGMPGLSGDEVAKRVRRDPQLAETLLVALTGWGQEEDRRRSRAAGFNHHLVKPVDLDTLRGLLRSL